MTASVGIGDRLFDRWRITDLLGQGAQGTVWKGEELASGRPVAIKELASDSEELRRRFRNEAELELDGPSAGGEEPYAHIVRPIHYGEVDGGAFFVMEYVEGRNLRDLLLRERRLTEERAIGVIEQVAAALAVAHCNNVIHRDVKPENVILTRNGHVKVSDFGIACFLTKERRTRHGATLGTVHYMSPEQVEDATRVDAASDMFSLGAVFYECLTGRRPFESEHVSELFMKILREEPLPPRKVLASISTRTEAIVLRMLRKRPEKRHPSMTALLDVLPRPGRGIAETRGHGMRPCPGCDGDNLVDSNFCQHCGRDLRVSCSGCGRQASFSDRFCRRCGSPVSRGGGRARLLGLRGGFMGKTILLDKALVTLGRHGANDLSFEERDEYVSRFQARIYREDGRFWIEGWDWVRNGETTNGTFVNGANVDGKGRILLGHGDRLRVGDSFFRFEVVADDRG